MAKKNFTITTVATAPSPATSGTSLVVASGTGSLFAINEPAIIFPVNGQPLVANAEIVMVTNVATDTLTITRTQESTSARTIVAGDIIIQGITAKDWNDIVTLIGKKANIVTGTSTTARIAAAKTCTIAGYTLTAGDLLAITFTDGFSVDNATLNINGVGAKNIRVGAVNVTTSLISVAATTSFVLPLYYDGTYFYAYGSSLNNTYTVPTEIPESEITAGTASTARAITGRRAEFLAASIKSRTETLTNKTIDGDNNTVQDLPYNAIKSTSRSGLDDKIITGTPNTTNLGLVQWNSDGDAVDSLIKPSAIETGWIDSGETWTYASADDPTYTFTVAADVTTKYSVGMKLKLTQGTVKYFIITAISAFTGGNTTITVYGGTDYDLADSAISANAYSMMRTPVGFPMSPNKWTVSLINNNNPEGAIAQNVWTNLGSVSISIPIGVWDVTFTVSSMYSYLNGTGTSFKATLSTANNSESDPSFIIGFGGDGATATLNAVNGTGTRRKILEITSKTTYYVNFTQTKAGTNYVGCSQRYVLATCAYL